MAGRGVGGDWIPNVEVTAGSVAVASVEDGQTWRVTGTNVLRGSSAWPLDAELVSSCLDLEQEGDRDFEAAWTMGLSRIPSGRRKARLLPVLGHVAESVTEVILADLGHDIVWHQIGGASGASTC